LATSFPYINLNPAIIKTAAAEHTSANIDIFGQKLEALRFFFAFYWCLGI